MTYNAKFVESSENRLSYETIKIVEDSRFDLSKGLDKRHREIYIIVYLLTSAWKC